MRASSTCTQIYVSVSSQRVPCDGFARKGYPMKAETNTASGWGPSFSTSWLMPRYSSLCKASRCQRYKAVIVSRRQTHLLVIYKQGILPMKAQAHFSLLPLVLTSPTMTPICLAACEGEASIRLLLVRETLLQSIVQSHPCWPLGLGQGTAWEDMGKRVWELVYRNSDVLKGVGFNGESEHSWGLAQVAKLLHLTFQ